ncbi:MAG: hypothetical protein MI702_07555, partial [Chlorobiales bacterium]|nr:hypothetical protein [Chlorobiales bacterium]
DSWSVNNKLTINYGFRYDSTGLRAEDPDIALAGEDTFLRFNDPAYRVGVAYDIGGDGKTVLRAFAGRYYEGVTSGNTEPLTGEVSPYYYWEGQLYGHAEEWVLIDVSGGSTGNFFVKDDIINMYTEGVTLGIERELMPQLSASATFIYKKDHHLMGTISPDATWDTEQYNLTTPNGTFSGTYFPNFSSGAREFYGTVKEGDVGVAEAPFRKFYGFVTEINKRMSDNWSLKANYVYSRNSANIGSGYGVIQGFRGYSDPNEWINTGGRSTLERPHVFKVSGTYIAPFDVYVSPAFTWSSGYALPTYITVNGVQFLAVETDGSERLDNQMNVDIRLEKAFVVMDRYRIGLILDAFNVFNDDAVTDMLSNDVTNPNFRVASEVVPARFFQVGVRLLF